MANVPLLPTIKDRQIDLINELYRSFRFFNEYFFKNELKEPIITIQGDKRSGSTYGWFGKDFWLENNEDKSQNKISELNLTAEALYREPKHVLETLLHEMAHLYNAQKDIFDCTKTQYHNDKFKSAAEKAGLEVSRAKNKGWAHTELSPTAITAIELLNPLVKAYKIVRQPPVVLPPEPKTINLPVDISYEEKVDYLLGHYNKKRNLAEMAVDLLYDQTKLKETKVPVPDEEEI